MPTELLSVKHHQQDTDYYCGAACAQMVLTTIGAGILDQDDLYADNHSHSTADAAVDWYTGPDGLAWTLNDRRPPAFTNSFVLFALTSEDAISRKICWTIHHYQVAPVALVFGWAHWIVVHGYDVSAHPISSGDTGYTINAFDVNNPWPPTPAGAAEPPHTGTDGCGTGGDRGIADEHVAYSTDWQDTYMTGVPGGIWSGKFLAVCDPEPPATTLGPQRPQKRLEGSRLISPASAVARFKDGLESYGLPRRKRWKDALQGTRAGAPLLVRRLDLPDSFYYIVPMQRGGKRTPVLGRVDARYGTYRGTVAVPSDRHAYSVIDRQAARVAGSTRTPARAQRGGLSVSDARLAAVPRVALALLAVLHGDGRGTPHLRAHRRRGVHGSPGPAWHLTRPRRRAIMSDAAQSSADRPADRKRSDRAGPRRTEAAARGTRLARPPD
jgi:hypothetical protein